MQHEKTPLAHSHHHQFEDAHQQYETSTMGMWVFLVTEIMFFGGLFGAYVVYRFLYPHGFAEASHHLDIFLGAFNTLVLITSSLTMAMAVHAAATSKKRPLVNYLILTFILGAMFLGVKAIEYTHKFHEHLIPGPDFHLKSHGFGVELFFSLYFAMTGMHAFHMVIGLGLLTYLIIQSSRNKFNSTYSTPVEMIGLYWHFVDIVWIFLFPLLYLLGRH